MKTLTAVHLVQFSFWEYETFLLGDRSTAFIGPNGAGKTSLADAIQIALVGANLNYVQFNAQSVHKDARSLRDYALGAMRSGEGDKGVVTRKRNDAMSYITLVFEDEETGHVFSAGLAIASSAKDPQAHVLGLYVLPGVQLLMEHHLEDLGAEGKAPQDWKVFESQLRALANAAGMSPTITGKPETYLDELLHNLADSKQSIDPRKFLKALKQSIRLKDVDSVGDFLRHNLVEATKIDKRGTLQHIQTLRRLGKQIDEVKLQLADLDTLTGRYEHLARQHRQRAVAQAVALQLQVESADTKVGGLRARAEQLDGAVEEGRKAVAGKADEVESTLRTYEELLAALQRDPEAAGPEQAKELLRARADMRQHARRALDALELRVAEALDGLKLAFEGRYVAEVQGAAQAARTWNTRRSRGETASPGQLKEALQLLERARGAADRLEASDRDEARKAVESKGAAEEKIKAADKGVRVRDNDVAAALGLFSSEGIKCHTVASVVSVRDVAWQGAIETFLGRNRHAIVVERGKERQAVGLLRRSAINEVAVVQPSHISDTIGRRPESGSVAELLNSRDDIALAFLVRILGKMRRVETEQELEEHPRSLTRDYMLSANGATRRMRPIAASEWTLGVQVSNADLSELREELQAAHHHLQEASQRAKNSQGACGLIARALKEVSLDTFSAALAHHEGAVAAHAAAADAAGAPLPDRLQSLAKDVAAARVRHTDAQTAHANAGTAVQKLENDRDSTKQDLVEAERDFERLRLEHAEAVAQTDHDPELSAKRLEAAYKAAASDGVNQTVDQLRAEASKATAAIDKAVPDIASQFTDFINRHSIGLVDERSEWRKAARWVREHHAKLQRSTLVDYQQQAHDAREAAEKAFESDVKYSLREALRRVTQEIDDLNSILDRCPPFTNNERYHFTAKIDKEHQALYELIAGKAGEAGTSPLFASGEVQSTLVKFLEAAEQGADKGNNPLEDYRLFYQFDLEIRVDGKPVDLLSKRVGVASNGEHRVPFYVVAGAALATAYRIKPGQRHRGAGVMILDEAFYGIDAQNTVVTAEFLKSLGLQLIMAGPDTDISKLTAVLDSYHELTRFGADVFVHRIEIKEKARKLMQSDMPERHPELVQRKVEQLALAAK